MKKLMLIGLGIVSLSIASARAEDNAAAAPAPVAPKIEKKHAPKVELKDVSVIGTIQKTEHTKKDGTVETGFKLVAENGTQYILRVPAKKDAPGSNLADLVGKKVKVTGKGQEGKRNVIHVIASIEAQDQAPVAPAAPAAK